MTVPIILASGSEIRAQLLRNAGLDFTVQVPRVDETEVRKSLEADATSPRDIADALAELKARRISDKAPGALVIGCDQVLDFDGQALAKPHSPEDALAQLTAMAGKTHRLFSAAVIMENGQPVWRHVGQVRLTMRTLSHPYLAAYTARNWESIRHAVGAYKLEEEGVRLIAHIDGDHFNVLGLPLMQLLDYLVVRGVIES